MIGLLLVVAALVLLAGGLGSTIGAVQMLRSKEGSSKQRRWLWALVALGLVGGGYLSVGLVYSSATTHWYGAPMPMVIFQPIGDHWGDFVHPLSAFAPFYNLTLWFGLAVSPVTLPRWWRRRRRA